MKIGVTIGLMVFESTQLVLDSDYDKTYSIGASEQSLTQKGRVARLI